MKAPTWAALALCLGRALPSEAAAGVDHIDQCDALCDAIKSEISPAEACAKARKSLPRPKIGVVCQEAFEKALELTCAEACQRHGTGRVPESRLVEACVKRKREVPRPVAHKACVDGFNAGFAATTAFIAERVKLPAQEPQMDGETKATLLEQHAFILEEVAAEFDYFVELDSPEQAEQGEKMQDSQPQSVGESSVDISRREDLTQMKQEWEAMHAENTAPTLTTLGQESKAQNVDIPNSGEVAEGGFAGKVGSMTSTAGMTLRGVDESHANVPPREGRDKLEKDASSGKGSSTMAELGPEFMEVLKAEHVKGFKDASRDKNIGNQVGEEPVKLPVPAEKKEAAGDNSEVNLVMELPQDGRFREVLTADHIKAYNNPSAGDKPRSNHGRSRPAGIGPGPAEEKETAGVNSEANLVTELPQDGRFQEVLTVGHVKAYNNPSSVEKPQKNRGRSRPTGIVPGPVEEKETAGVSSEANLVTKLPQDGRFQEVLTVDHVKAYNNKPRSNHGRSRPADTTSRTEDVPALGIVELEDFVTLGEPEPPLSANEKRLEALSPKEAQPRDMQEGEDATLVSEGNN